MVSLSPFELGSEFRFCAIQNMVSNKRFHSSIYWKPYFDSINWSYDLGFGQFLIGTAFGGNQSIYYEFNILSLVNTFISPWIFVIIWQEIFVKIFWIVTTHITINIFEAIREWISIWMIFICERIHYRISFCDIYHVIKYKQYD